MKTREALSLDPARQQALDAARVALDHARRGLRHPRDHRSVRRLAVSPIGLLEIFGLGLALTGLLVAFQDEIVAAWDALILWWANRLDIPLSLTEVAGRLHWTHFADEASLVPGPLTGVATAAAVIAAFAGTFWMSDRLIPVKYLIRTLCVVQASALLFFMFTPSLFPYSVGGHLSAMLTSGFYLMLAMPLLLAAGYGVLNIPLRHKLLHPLGIMAYFALMLPHKALLHVLVLQHFSVLFMPLLYLCFGLLFDLMVFVALYSWLVSRVPDRAIG